MNDSNDLTPSARIIKKANEIKTIKDSLGRVIKYRSLKPSDQLEMVTLIGTERALNAITISMCSAAYRVTEVDGIVMFTPETFQELKNNMDELGDEGLSALYDAFRNITDKPKDEQADKKVKVKE